MQLTLDCLANHREFIPQLAAWSYAEWRHVYDQCGLTFGDAIPAFHRRAKTDALPLTIVAIADGAVVGTGALKADDLPPRAHLTPWLAGIFVAREHRGRGIASAIIDRLLDEARRLRLPRLYLWTNSAASLYAKLGWRDFEKLEYCGQEISVMVRQLEPMAKL
ncbi:MAG TPA: GNAT family N-acetyltransferase [Chthoniobacterales bacterium]|nr:GNAT family N-acetyltransferase [Chthoniobacterales bacterium]